MSSEQIERLRAEDRRSELINRMHEGFTSMELSSFYWGTQTPELVARVAANLTAAEHAELEQLERVLRPTI